MRKFYIISFLVFLTSFILGIVFYSPDIFIPTNKTDSEVVVGIKDFYHIALNNLTVLLSLFLGFFSFGLLSLGILIYNGFMFGVIFTNLHVNGIPLKIILSGSVAHGVIEITAFIIAAAWGLKGFLLLRQIDKMFEEGRFFKETKFLKSITGCTALIILAAAIEYFISFRLIGLW